MVDLHRECCAVEGDGEDQEQCPLLHHWRALSQKVGPNFLPHKYRLCAGREAQRIRERQAALGEEGEGAPPPAPRMEVSEDGWTSVVATSGGGAGRGGAESSESSVQELTVAGASVCLPSWRNLNLLSC